MMTYETMNTAGEPETRAEQSGSVIVISGSRIADILHCRYRRFDGRMALAFWGRYPLDLSDRPRCTDQ
jgi:hypothetical protein